jgi:pantoate--beta-alanine ligase
VRETDGLALSSRNQYLGPEERKDAVALSEALRLGEELVKSGESDCRKIITAMETHIRTKIPYSRIDYVSAVDPDTLEDTSLVLSKTVFALAVYVGATRLIDNMMVSR